MYISQRTYLLVSITHSTTSLSAFRNTLRWWSEKQRGHEREKGAERKTRPKLLLSIKLALKLYTIFQSFYFASQIPCYLVLESWSFRWDLSETFFRSVAYAFRKPSAFSSVPFLFCFLFGGRWKLCFAECQSCVSWIYCLINCFLLNFKPSYLKKLFSWRSEPFWWQVFFFLKKKNLLYYFIFFFNFS